MLRAPYRFAPSCFCWRLVSMVAMPYTVLMPVFASKVLHGGPHTLGFLMASTGVGALIGSLTLALRKSVLGLGKRISIASALFGISLIGFALSHTLWLSLVFLAVTGFGMMQNMAASNTILQTIVDDEKRGRVMAFYSMAVQGMSPFGSLIAGFLAARAGAAETLVLGGILCTAGSIWFARQLPDIRRFIRPIYIQRGILPNWRWACKKPRRCKSLQRANRRIPRDILR